MTFEVAGITVHLVKKRIKHINLRIHPNGEVRLSAPYGTPQHFIQRFLDEKEAWIVQHRHRLKSRVVNPEPTYSTGEMHAFLGQTYPLVVCDRAPYDKIQFADNSLYCFSKGESSLERRRNLLQAWYRQQMTILLPDLVAKWENHIGVKANHYTIRIMKRRWGTCYPKTKHILFNLSLIQKSLPCLEYVIVHELVHLLEASHNKRFYALMTQFMPQWRMYSQQLSGKSV